MIIDSLQCDLEKKIILASFSFKVKDDFSYFFFHQFYKNKKSVVMF